MTLADFVSLSLTTSTDFAARPSWDEIAARAFAIHLARGGEPGRDQDDWFEAERELAAEYAQATFAAGESGVVRKRVPSARKPK